MSRLGSNIKSPNRLLLIKQIVVLVSKISVFLLLFISIIVFSVNKFQPESIEPARVEVADSLNPLSRYFNYFIKYVTTVFKEVDYIINSNSYNVRYKKLKNENFKLKLSLYLKDEENKRLKKVLNYIPEKKKSFYTARIISRNPGPYVRAAFIESDKIEELKDDLIVINDDGLVGQIDNVSADVASVILLTDSRSNIPVKSRNSGKRAILVGNGTTNPELDFILSTKKLIVGEEILTSGDGGYFPPDIPVGYIEKIENERVIIETYVDWASLDYVYILK